MRHRDRAVVIGRDGVVCADIGEHRNIDVCNIIAVHLVVAVPDRANDGKLAGIDSAR